MKLKIKEIDIPKDEPFRFDALNRQKHIEPLTNIIDSVDEPFVLSIDSSWGTGKTTFVKMWKQNLENNGYPTIYFNAWENDFTNEALASIISEIDYGVNEIKSKLSINPNTFKKIDKMKKASYNLMKIGIPLIVRLGTSGVLDLSKITEKEIANILEKVAIEEIRKYENSKKSIIKFKSILNDIIAELNKSEKIKDKPLIIFIDELDRCRPNFAIELLEKVKHLFDIKGIVFILSIDKSQLKHSISSIYGSGMKADGYLRRFIDLEFTLPIPDEETFVKNLFTRYNFEEFFNGRTHNELIDEDTQLITVFA